MSDVKLVVFDWAGTTVDFGCLAPTGAFVAAFAARGVAVPVRMARAEAVQARHQPLQGKGVCSADTQHQLVIAPLQRCHLALQGLQKLTHGERQLLALVRQTDLPGLACKKGKTQAGLQLFDLLADRCRGFVQLVCGQFEAGPARAGLKVQQAGEVAQSAWFRIHR